MVTGHAWSPPIINDNILLDWAFVIEPSNKISRIPVNVIGTFVTIWPHDARLVFVYLKNKNNK